jgi:subtilase family serine protease
LVPDLHKRIRLPRFSLSFLWGSRKTYSASSTQVKFHYRLPKTAVTYSGSKKSVTYRKTKNRLLEVEQLLLFTAEKHSTSATIKRSSSRSFISISNTELQKFKKDSSEDTKLPLARLGQPVKLSTLRRSAAAACILYSTLLGHSQTILQTLHGHVRPAVLRGQAVAQGLMPQSQHMNLSIVLPLRNQAGLTSLLSGLYDPSSADYHKFLSAAQFNAQFAPTTEDYQAVVAYAQANGFTVGAAPANRRVVPISGTVAQVQKAFNVRMALYQHPTENRLFFSPDREPSLNLSVHVAHIAGLDNYSVPQPMYHRNPEPENQTSYVTEGSGPGGSFLASDMRAAYYGGTALTGTGQTVALLEFDGYNLSDVNQTFSSVGQSYSVPVNNVLLDGATGASVSGNDSEEVLDIVQAIGMAPGLSQVRVYIGGNDVDILNSIASEDVAQEVSISWSWSPDDPATDDSFLEQCAAQGQSVFASSGDWGEFDPYFDDFYPAEDPYVTSVGGTDLSTAGGGGPWASETAWSRSGGGISPDGIPIPAWQAGVATSTNGGSNTLRNVPDVAAQADFVNYSCAMGACAGDYGGTSFSAPRWAAFMALVNQQAVSAGNPTVGFINPALYAIGEGNTYSADFHDITYGNNDARNNCCGWPYYNAVAGYDLVTGWGSPSGQSLIDELAPPAPASFDLSPASTVLTVAHGNSGRINIAVTGKGGFTAAVELAVGDLPAGVTASWGPDPTATSTDLTLAVAKTVARGSYLITVNGAAGPLTASTSFVLDVTAVGFSMAPSPANLSLYPGTSSSTTILVTGYSGFKSSVNFAVTSGLPDGVTASWASNPTATGAALLTFTASDSVAQNTDAVVTITGTSFGLTATTTVALVVNPPSFYVNMSPYPSTITQGGSFTTTVTVTGVPAERATDTIRLSAPELPAGVTASFNPATIPLGQSSTLTLTASNSAPTGTSVAGVEADGTAEGTLSQFALTVTSKATPSFTLAASQSAPTVIQGSSVSDVITVTPQNSFKSSVALAISPGTPLPAGVTASFTPSVTTGSSQLTFRAGSTAAAGLYPLQITGTSGTLTAVANVYLTVNPPALFSLSAAPASVTVAQYASATDSITVTPQSGFTGSVRLYVLSALPTGVTAAFAPNTTTSNSTLTLTAGGTAVAGNYSITIAGTSGGHVVTTALPITITASSTVPTSTALSITPTGALTVGSTYTLTTRVTPAGGTVPPTGSVIFTIGGVAHTVALNASGIATYAGTAPAAAGALAISAAYQGTTVFLPSASATLNVSVVGIATTTALSISPNGSTMPAGSQFTLTATVITESGMATPNGSVVFNIGGTSQTVALNASGVATYTGTAPSAAGDLAILAAYQGSSGFAASTSVTLDETIPTVATSTSLSISPSAGSLTVGSSYTVTAKVTPATGTTVPSGFVIFYIGDYPQSVAVDATGVATSIRTAPLTPGNLAITAAYQGSAQFAGSTSITLNEPLTVTGTSTTLAISPDGSSLAAGSSYTLTATVTAQAGSAAPTGNVVFKIGSATQTAALNASGVATYTGTMPAAAGSVAISAAYQGQGGFSASASNTLTETIYTSTATQAFALAATSLTVTAGASTGNTSTITITPSGGFSGGVTLTASITDSPLGAKNLPSLRFAASSVSVSAVGTATTNLIVTTTSANTAANDTRSSGSPWYASGGAALACLLLFGIPARRRAWQRYLGMVVLLVALVSGAAGCSSSFTTNGTSAGSGTTPGIYLINVKGASGATTASTSVTLTVQ